MPRSTRSKKSSTTSASTGSNTVKLYRPIADRAPAQSYRLGTFDAVPTAVLRLIQQYLSSYDYRQLLNTNARMFQHAKFETVSLQLISSDQKMKGFKSLKEQKEYLRDLSMTAVQNRSQQVSLRLQFPTIEEVEAYGSSFQGLQKLRLVDNATGNFWRAASTNRLDINLYFSNIDHVIFQNVDGIEQLQGLQGIKTLEIHNSSTLTSIAFIPGLQRLVLNNCQELSDISEYHSIPELSITNCWKLSFTNLGNHQKVKLSHTAHVGHNPDYSVFAKVPYLSISSTTFPKSVNDLSLFSEVEYLEINGNGREISAAGLLNNRYLGLHYCSLEWSLPLPRLEIAELYHCKILETKPLKHVQSLRITSCEGEIDFKAMPALKRLILEDLPQVSDVSMLGDLEELQLINCPNITDVSYLGKVKKLSIIGCEKVVSLVGLGKGNQEIEVAFSSISDFRPIGSVMKVSLEYCVNLTSTKDLVNVRCLSIAHCEALVEVTPLPHLDHVILRECPQIESIAGLQQARTIHLERCNRVDQLLNDIRRPERLVINYCEAIHQSMKADRQKKYDKFFKTLPYVRLNCEGLLPPSKQSQSLLPDLFC